MIKLQFICDCCGLMRAYEWHPGDRDLDHLGGLQTILKKQYCRVCVRQIIGTFDKNLEEKRG